MQKVHISILLILISCLAVGIFAFESTYHSQFNSALVWAQGGLTALFNNAYERIFGRHLFNVSFWIVLGVTLFLQRLFPVHAGQKIFHKGLFQDLIWFIYEPFFSIFVYGTYILWVKGLFARHLGYLSINVPETIPAWVRFLMAILLLDFLNWLQHFVHHKVPFLWTLHSVHHSQTDLNFFSAYRFHVLEFVVRNAFLVFPFFVLNLSAPTIVAYVFFEQWYVRFYHASIRTNLGPLKYFLVTPQSHRVHHSKETVHFDKNFGALFSIWDYIFRTQHTGYNDYPETGIPDAKYPLQHAATFGDLIRAPFSQMTYSVTKSFAPWKAHRKNTQNDRQ